MQKLVVEILVLGPGERQMKKTATHGDRYWTEPGVYIAVSDGTQAKVLVEGSVDGEWVEEFIDMVRDVPVADDTVGDARADVWWLNAKAWLHQKVKDSLSEALEAITKRKAALDAVERLP